jgi:hypothetical protein
LEGFFLTNFGAFFFSLFSSILYSYLSTIRKFKVGEKLLSTNCVLPTMPNLENIEAKIDMAFTHTGPSRFGYSWFISLSFSKSNQLENTVGFAF